MLLSRNTFNVDLKRAKIHFFLVTKERTQVGFKFNAKTHKQKPPDDGKRDFHIFLAQPLFETLAQFHSKTLH